MWRAKQYKVLIDETSRKERSLWLARKVHAVCGIIVSNTPQFGHLDAFSDSIMHFKCTFKAAKKSSNKAKTLLICQMAALTMG